jgi:HEAT repeat protein
VLAEAMNGHPEVGVTEIKRYLDNFGWESLSGITDLMGEFEHSQHREALKDYLTARGQDNIDIVAKGVYDKRWQVVRNSVTILARIGDARALRYLERVVQHEEPQVRMELVTALKTCPIADSLDLLKILVADSDRTIRGLAVEAIVARRGEAAFEVIGEVIDNDSFALLDRVEQQSLLNAYSSLGGEQAVGYLSPLILRFNLFGDARQSVFRTAAFEALSYNHSERSERLLIKLSSSWRPSIRKQAAYTLQRRRENIYGKAQ